MTFEEAPTAIRSIEVAMPGTIHAPGSIDRSSLGTVGDHIPNSEVETFWEANSSRRMKFTVFPYV
jgi:hypothetical protein